MHDVKIRNAIKKEIRIKHPAYIFLEKDNLFIYVTLTHSNKVAGLLSIKLRKNPNPNDKLDSYWVAEIREDEKRSFTRIKTKWSIDELDDKDIRDFFEKQKNR